MRRESNGIKSSQPDVPRVVVLHDSVHDNNQGKRLGQSHGLDVIKLKTSTIEDINKTVNVLDYVAGPVDAIAVHCGINDIKSKDPKTVGKSLVKSLREIVKEHS